MAEHPHKARASAQGNATADRHGLTAFAGEVLAAAGADPREAQVVADVLVWADRVGRPTQGVWRLPILVQRLERGMVRSPCDPVMEPISDAAVIVDGGNGLGHFVADFAMRHAIELASRSAVGIASVRNSNYLGATGYYAQMAAAAGMIGIAMSNSFPKVAAHGGKEPVLGTNPLAFAAPQANGESILLDMATASSSGSALRWHTEERADASEPDPAATGEAVGGHHEDVIEPFGGAKGFGIGLMVEILSAALSGAGLSHEVGSMYRDFTHAGNNGHFFLALDVRSWTSLSTFHERTGNLLRTIEASGAEQPSDAVRIPGQARWASLARSESEGIVIDGRVRAALEGVGSELGVPVPW